MIGPGATIGIIGGGQLGRMIAMSAAQLGYRCHIFAPDPQPVAGEIAAVVTRGAYDDRAALEQFGAACDIVTYEFENVPVEPLAVLGDKLRPGVKSLAVAQDRAAEKQFIERCGAIVAPWCPIDCAADVETAIEALALPLVLKTRRLGYDGKGQAWVRSPSEAAEAWEAIGAQPAVAEAAVEFAAEFSLVLARSIDGEVRFWDAPRNEHHEGILRRSTVPAGPLVEPHVQAAKAMASRIAEALGHVGVLTTEFFACADGPLVNEIAPRVHNSGHWTIEGAATSQFEQHVRAICGLPLGSTAVRSPRIAMDNLIGDDALAWRELLAEPGAALHLYGKGEPRPGRKMGHVTRLG
ncbi:5-(carboxyamino)imidazole ribonucleotide synthase [Sphingomonas ginkgonis]|uniref:N5-carboxyaminoimidazole ribonucleotide synthase n=1 Tax=Sphingomonas ginkgonis TaxID=2315330 RepID=A0A429V6B4_9SPHN|nr:5-(carboxyamino)imidazole ribonucleotide synthase [Sphingomonas ginkgonis]RST29464.1 5-(carboxyamino)imidazole ribonucleotide synthase [Sphingomonas ginkgonis]